MHKYCPNAEGGELIVDELGDLMDGGEGCWRMESLKPVRVGCGCRRVALQHVGEKGRARWGGGQRV